MLLQHSTLSGRTWRTGSTHPCVPASPARAVLCGAPRLQQQQVQQLQRQHAPGHTSAAAGAAASGGAADDLPPAGSGAAANNSASASSSSSSTSSPKQGGGLLQWLRDRFGSSKLDKEKLAKYGLGAFLAYGVVSNLNAGVLVTMAWLTVVKQTGLTPLDPGMWPRFLGIYAGLYMAFGNLLRPARLALSLAAAPLFNSALEWLQGRLGVPKAAAFGVMLCAVATTSCTAIATMLVVSGGFPNGLPPLPWK